MTHEELVEKVAREVQFAIVNDIPVESIARRAISTIAETLAEPTEEMDRAGGTMDRHYWPGSRLEHWSAMLAASPLYPEKTDD